jgi:hypothetical protein
MRTQALLTAAILLAVWRPASACSLAPPTDPVDGFVFYGEVVGYVEAPYLTGSTFGIKIVPRYEFRVPVRTPDGSYDIYPMGLAPDCRAMPLTSSDERLEIYKVGSIVGVVGAVPGRSPIPGDIDVNWIGERFVVDSGCDVAELARREHDYGEPHVQCGSYRFEVNKDIALLDAATPAQRLATLARLARYRRLLKYLDLLGKYVPDAVAGRRLLELRYGGVMPFSCLASEWEIDALDWERRARWNEYCTQRDPYDPRSQAAADLYDAIAQHRIAVAEDFLAEGGDPNEPLWGAPMGAVYPLDVAVRARDESIVLALLRAGADFERSGVDPYVISDTGMERVWEFLLTQRSDRLDGALETLGAACGRHAYYDVVDVVTRHALAAEWNPVLANPNALGSCIAYSPDSARLLLERGVPVTGEALNAAAGHGSVGIVRLLLERGADPFERYSSNDGSDVGEFATWTAIDFAWREYEFKDAPARQRVDYILHELAAGPGLKSGQRVDGRARDARAELETYADPADQLEFAARFGLYDDVAALIAESDAFTSPKLPADSAAFTPAELRTAVRAALAGHNPDVARLLLASGAPTDGGTLHDAVRIGPAGIVKHLLALGAGVNEQVDSATPLEAWIATDAREVEVLNALVAAGADVCGIVAKLEPDGWPRDTLLRAAGECTP